jgi:hypothetical protein
MKKMWNLFVAAVILAGVGVALNGYALSAGGPICDTAAWVNSTTYYNCSGSTHTALDIGNGTCGSWNHRAMLNASKYYHYYGGCGYACYGSSCNGGAGNYYVVSGANGWDFRQLHFIANVSSGSTTCDGCALGLVGGTGSATGPHSHSDNRQYGTRKAAWYNSAGTTCGTSGNCTHIEGYPTL